MNYISNPEIVLAVFSAKEEQEKRIPRKKRKRKVVNNQTMTHKDIWRPAKFMEHLFVRKIKKIELKLDDTRGNKDTALKLKQSLTVSKKYYFD